MGKSVAEKVAALQRQKAQIEARLGQLKAREKSIERKRDTRRKVIAGAYALEHCEFDPAFKATLFGLLDQYVERPGDRELFDLPPKRKPSEAGAEDAGSDSASSPKPKEDDGKSK